MARRRGAKIGLLETFMYAGAIAEASNSQLLNHPITRAARDAANKMGLHSGQNQFVNAIAMVLAGKIIHTEANKAGFNPAFGPVRLL